MAIVVGRMVALLEAKTAQFEARMAAAGQQLHRLTSTTSSARQGTQLLRIGFQNLAFQGLGALPGPLARAATGLGILAFGSPLIVGVLVAGAAITAIFKAHAQAATEAAERIRGYQNQLQGLVVQGKPVAQIEQQITELLLGDAKKRKPLEDVEAEANRLQRAVAAGAVGKAGEDRLAALTTEINLRRQIIAFLERQQTIERENVRLAFAAAQAAAAERNARLLALNLGQTIALRLGKPSIADTGVFPDVPRLRIPEPLVRTPESIRAARRQMHEEEVAQRVGGLPAGAPGFQFTPEFGVMASMALMQGIAGGGGIGGFLGAAAGPVAMIDPLAGAITAGVGGIFSLFDQSEERRHNRLVDEIRKLGQEVGLERVTVVFTGPDGHQVRKSLSELESGDAVERVPGPVGATG